MANDEKDTSESLIGKLKHALAGVERGLENQAITMPAGNDVGFAAPTTSDPFGPVPVEGVAQAGAVKEQGVPGEREPESP